MKKTGTRAYDSLNAQLRNLTGRPMNSPRQSPRLNFHFQHITDLPHYGRWKGDGKDHINISQQAATGLGQALYTSFQLKFVHDVFGPLNSISQLWNQIDDLVGAKAINIPEAQLPFLLADAMWQKVKQYPKLAEEIKDTTMLFDMYQYNTSDLPFRTGMAYWWLETVYAIKDALVNDAEYPNFNGLIQGKRRTRDEFMTAFLDKYVPNRRRVEEAPAKQTRPEPAPLVKELRATPPVIVGMRKFSMTLDVSTKKSGATPQEPAPALAPVENPAPEIKSDDLHPETVVNTEVVVDPVSPQDEPAEVVVQETTDPSPAPTDEDNNDKAVLDDHIATVDPRETSEVTEQVEEPEQEELADTEVENRQIYSEETGKKIEDLLISQLDLEVFDAEAANKTELELVKLLMEDSSFVEVVAEGDFNLDFVVRDYLCIISAIDGKVTSTSNPIESNEA